MILLLARNHPEAEWWCNHQDPRINPRSKEVVILTGPEDDRKLRGLRLQEGDRIVEYHGGPQRSGLIYRSIGMLLGIEGWKWDVLEVVDRV